MRTVSLFLLLLLWPGSVLAAVASRAPAPPEPRLRRFALIASSNDGGRDRVRLRFADSDAVSMADVLRTLGGLRGDDLVLLTGARRDSFQASLDRVGAALQRASGGSIRREIIVYYAGHSDEQGLLLAGERVSYQELRRWIDATGADVRIAILDSCASGALIRSRGGTLRPAFLDDLSTSARGHAFLTASSADEAAQESDRIGAAVFTHYLLSGLRGAADLSRDGRVTLAEAYQFAFHETLGRTERTAAGPQHPAYDIQLAGTGDLVLTDLRAHGASLVLEDQIAGRVFVRDGAGRLLVELRKEPLYPVQLGLAPGRYRVTIDADGRAFEAVVSLRESQTTRLGHSQLALAQLQPAAARGSSAPQTTTVGALALASRPAIGGYAGMAMRYGRIDGRDGLFAGFEGGLLFNRRYSVGVAVVGGTTGDVEGPEGRVAGGFAAVTLRYRLLFEGSPFDLTAGVLAGPGGIGRVRSGQAEENSTIFVFEPQLEAHLNLTRWLRLGADAGYRLAAGSDRLRARRLQGPTAGFHAQLGWF
jgi:hypothetical protein